MSAGAGAAAAAALAQAIKAMGTVVRVESGEFLRIVDQNPEPLIVHATGGFFSAKELYLTSYRGFVFFTKSDMPLPLTANCQIIEARKIWIPG
jgi:hypothetical protein